MSRHVQGSRRRIAAWGRSAGLCCWGVVLLGYGAAADPSHTAAASAGPGDRGVHNSKHTDTEAEHVRKTSPNTDTNRLVQGVFPIKIQELIIQLVV